MGVSVEQWRAAIGSYNAGKSCSLAHSSSYSRVPVLLSDLFSLLCSVATTSLQSVMKALMLLILLSGDVERNPGPDIMDFQPTLRELFDFPGKIGHFNIAERIGIHYQVVGTGLLKDDRGEVIPAIISEHGKKAEQINMDILRCWVQGKGIADRTWRGLLGVLSKHCPGLAQDIEETLRAETDTSDTTSVEAGLPCHGPQSALSRFSAELRARYAKYPLPHYSNPQCRKWIPHISKEYIHPDIISKEEQEEQPDSHKVAVLRGQQWRITKKDGGTPVQLAEILEATSGECVLVEGGPGMGKTTLAWQVCHRWGREELFVQYSTVLLLPLRDKRVQDAKQVEDLFFYLRDKKAQEEVIQDIGKGKETLIILDGLDELPSHLLSEQSIFTDLLSGEVLGDATILVTSRPSATQQLLTCWKQRILKHFVIHGFNEGDIDKYAKSILSGKKLMDFRKCLSIHPHIQSIMYVPLHSAIVMAVYLQHKQLPKTRTQLYVALAETILSQYLDDHPEYCGEEDVSSAIGLQLPKPVNAHFNELCKIAFNTVCRQELIFTDKTMPKVLHDIGFTDSVPGLYMYRTCSYNFLHLSIQEFLAAYHVSLLSPQEQELLLPRSCLEHHFKNMMRFVAGLTNFKGIRREAVKKVLVGVYDIIDDNREYCLGDYSLELLHECQNVSILDKEDTYSANLKRYSQEYHWLALGYCIANSKCAWKLDLSDVHIQMLVQGLHDCKTHAAYTIKHIEWALYMDEEADELITQSPAFFTNHIESICIKSPPIHEVDLSRLLTAIPSLKTLELKNVHMNFKNMLDFASRLKQNQSLSNVDISNCSIGSDSACCLARELHSNTTLTELDMSHNLVGERGALAMAEMLKHNTTLTELNMGGNSRSMVVMAEMNTRIWRRDSVDERGALAMADMITRSRRGNSVDERGALAMADMNAWSRRRNSVDERGALAMADMNVWSRRRNSVDERGALAMADMNAWSRRRNSVDERGALAMADMHMRMHLLITTLTRDCIFDMDCDYTIDTEGAKALVESLAVNHHLKTLYISVDYEKVVEALPAYHANKERVSFN